MYAATYGGTYDSTKTQSIYSRGRKEMEGGFPFKDDDNIAFLPAFQTTSLHL